MQAGIRVCCFPSKQISSVYNIQISPDSFEEWPYAMKEVCVDAEIIGCGGTAKSRWQCDLIYRQWLNTETSSLLVRDAWLSNLIMTSLRDPYMSPSEFESSIHSQF